MSGHKASSGGRGWRSNAK